MSIVFQIVTGYQMFMNTQPIYPGNFKSTVIRKPSFSQVSFNKSEKTKYLLETNPLFEGKTS